MNNTVRFNYLYRDASNYKEWGSVDFTNPERLPLESVDNMLRESFEHGELFIAHQVGLPELFFYAEEPITEDDHCYHEFHSVEAIEPAGSEPPTRSISEFLTDVRSAAASGWRAFNPADRLLELRAHTGHRQ